MDGVQDLGVTRGVGRVLGPWILQKVSGTAPVWAMLQPDRFTWPYMLGLIFISFVIAYQINCTSSTFPWIRWVFYFWTQHLLCDISTCSIPTCHECSCRLHRKSSGTPSLWPQALAEALKVNKTLTDINLEVNWIGREGAEAWGSARGASGA